MCIQDKKEFIKTRNFFFRTFWACRPPTVYNDLHVTPVILCTDDNAFGNLGPVYSLVHAVIVNAHMYCTCALVDDPYVVGPRRKGHTLYAVALAVNK